MLGFSEPEEPMPCWKKIGFWICGIEKQDKAPQMTDVSDPCHAKTVAF